MKLNLFSKITRAKKRKIVRRSKSREVVKVKMIDKSLVRDLLKNIVLGQIANTGSSIGFVFDFDSIITSGGRLVGAQSTELPQVKGYTVVLYVECLYRQFEIDQKNDLSPTHENMEKLHTFLKRLVADQIFAIESQPLKN